MALGVGLFSFPWQKRERQVGGRFAPFNGAGVCCGIRKGHKSKGKCDSQEFRFLRKEWLEGWVFTMYLGKFDGKLSFFSCLHWQNCRSPGD